MSMELAGKTALVTGAGSGIGRATALKLAEAGANVAALSYGAEETAAVAAEIEALGRRSLPLVADVSSDDQMRRAFEKAAAEFGTIDIVFANAGINGTWAPIEEMTVQEWDQVHAVNLRGTFLTVHYAIPLMKQHGGAITITSSINGTTAFSYVGASAYGTTKLGQQSFTKMAALELARYKIRVNAVCPGGIQTNIENSTVKRNLESVRFPIEYPQGQIPLNDGKPGAADDIADAVLFLSSPGAKHITGAIITVDGGQTLVA